MPTLYAYYEVRDRESREVLRGFVVEAEFDRAPTLKETLANARTEAFARACLKEAEGSDGGV
jgi:hypothetical protein